MFASSQSLTTPQSGNSTVQVLKGKIPKVIRAFRLPVSSLYKYFQVKSVIKTYTRFRWSFLGMETKQQTFSFKKKSLGGFRPKITAVNSFCDGHLYMFLFFFYQMKANFNQTARKKQHMYVTLHLFNTHTANTKEKKICKYLHLLSCTLDNSHDSFLYPVAIRGKK